MLIGENAGFVRLAIRMDPRTIKKAPGVQHHSARRTLMRSMEAARRAGSNEASHTSYSEESPQIRLHSLPLRLYLLALP
jgi:hypothetical protein